MNETRKGLARYRVERARATLEDAKLLLENGKHHSTANRSYYAAFYAARALMALKGLDSSKHSGFISTFNREFVKTGLVEQDAGRVLQRLFDGRTEGDYRDLIDVDAVTAQKLFEAAAGFVSSVCALVERELSAAP